MKSRAKNIRFGFIVFISLVIFCVAQLSWWIVFQIDQSGKDYDNRVALLEMQKDFTAEEMNELKDEYKGRIRMFAGEGSIFFIIMIIGAYLIYRTLQKSEELKKQQINFMHAVTHELRTPLTSIRLYLETLQGGNVGKDRIDSVFSKMLSDCDRLDTMIDNVLEAGRLDTNKFEMNLSKTNLSNDLTSYIADIENYIRQQNGVISHKIQSDINVKADYQALSTVIKAIIENGLKYSPADRRIININLKREGKFTFLEISDKGFGIPSSELDNIFDRFYRINNDNTKRVKGTGLGLYIASQIVKAHKGKITVERDTV